MKILINWLILLIALTVIETGCVKDSGPVYIDPDTLPPQDTDTIPLPTVSFSSDVQPVFDFKCFSCHNPAHPKLNLDSCCSWDQLLVSGFSAPYVNVDTPAISNLMMHINGELSLMPPFGDTCSAAEKQIILTWITEGALDN
jgi:hypothetical protein